MNYVSQAQLARKLDLSTPAFIRLIERNEIEPDYDQPNLKLFSPATAKRIEGLAAKHKEVEKRFYEEKKAKRSATGPNA